MQVEEKAHAVGAHRGRHASGDIAFRGELGLGDQAAVAATGRPHEDARVGAGEVVGGIAGVFHSRP